MANLIFFLIAVVAVLILKDGVFSCSLQSHKSPCSSATSHHSSVLRPLSTQDKTSPPCGSSTISRSCAPNTVPNASNDLESPSKPTSSSGMYLPVSTSVVPPTLNVSSNYSKSIFDLIIQMLSPLEKIGPPVTQKSFIPLSNPAQVSGLGKKPCTIPRICNSLSSSSLSSAALSNARPSLPYGLGLPSTTAQVPSLPVSIPAPSSSPSNSFQTSNGHSDLLNFFFELLSIVSGTKVSLVSKPKPLSPPCPLFKPALNNDVEIVTSSKPVATTFNCTSFGSSPFSNGMPHISTLPSKIKSPEAAPEEFPAQVSTANPTSSQVSTSFVPIPAPTSTISIVSGQNNSTLINLLIKCLLSTRAPIDDLVSLTSNSPSPCSLLTSIKNKTPVIPSPKPQTTPAPCVRTLGSNPCSSKVLQSLSSVSIISPNLNSTYSPSAVPASTSTLGIPSGYNPNFIRLLIKQLLSTHPTSLPAPLNTSFSLFHTKLNTTPVFPSKPNTFSTSISNDPLTELNNNLLGISLNKSHDLAPTSTPSSSPVSNTNPNITLVSGHNNSAIMNLLIKCLLSTLTPTGEPISLASNSSSPCSLLTSIINKTSITPTPKPQTTPALCATTSGSNFCSSSALSSLLSVPILSPNLTYPSASVPVSNSTLDIPSDYDPNFISNLIKQLLSTYSISLPISKSTLNTSFPLFYSKLNMTSTFPTKPNTYPTITSNPPLTKLNSNLVGVLLNKSCNLPSKSIPFSTPEPITNPNISMSNNSVLTNLLCKVLSPTYIPLKTHPCLPPLNLHPIPTSYIPNIPVSRIKPLPTSIPCTSSLSPADIVPVSNTPSPAVLKQFPVPNQSLNADTVMKPTLRPHLCHTKHSRVIHPTSTSSSTIPHIKHILRPFTSSSTLPCSKPSRLGSGCKHSLLI